METPEFYQATAGAGNYYNTHHHHDNFVIDDLLNYPNDDLTDDVPADSSTLTLFDTSNSSSSFSPADNGNHFTGDLGSHFSTDLCVPPYEEVAELEWLSNFVEDSFSSEEFQKLQLISGVNPRPNGSSDSRQPQPESNQINNNNPVFRPEVPGKARSKRSRAAPGNWASRLLLLSPAQAPTPTSSDTDSGKKTVKAALQKKDVADVADNSAATSSGDGRRCLHCATDKTPQWRTGPMGPKTLCNACGVRYKSGRLVPEYRPAASPTFVLTKHSNSHRKVMELRRQKDVHRTHNHQQQFLHPGWFMISTDGSCMKDEKAAIGLNIRDHRDTTVAAMAAPIPQSSDPSIAEALAVKEGLLLAARLNLQQIILLVDLQKIPKYFDTGWPRPTDLSAFGAIMDDRLHISHRFSGFKCS